VIFDNCMSTIYIARHGETNLNKERRFQGISNPHLNDCGIEHADKIARYFSDNLIYPNEIYTSNLWRSIETGEIISNVFRMNGQFICVKLSEGLREISFGDLEGCFKEEALIREPSFSRSFYVNMEFCYPDGESLLDVYNRIRCFSMNLVRPELNLKVLIVGHSGINRMIRSHLLGIPPRSFVFENQEHTEIIEIDTLMKTEKKFEI
jgi:alpha-ribazole phosphatase